MTWCWDWRWAWRGCLFDAIYGLMNVSMIFLFSFWARDLYILLHASMIGVRGIEHEQRFGLIQAHWKQNRLWI